MEKLCKKNDRRNHIAPRLDMNKYQSLDIKDSKISIEDEVINKEIEKELNLVIIKLDDKFKIPIIMYYTVEMPIDEIARALKVPKGTVKSRLHKGRSIIKKNWSIWDMKDYKNIDDLLKKSLSSQELPSKGLDVELKIKVENQVSESNGLSIWWLPMMISTAMGSVGYVFIKSFVSPGWIQSMLVVFCVASVIFNLIMTTIGVKYFELKKGARVNI